MNQYVTGAVIKELREKKHMTQMELADKLFISDKTVSKWETGKGYPDITLLESIAAAFDVSVTELLSGNAVQNTNVSANMLRSGFYVCPVCGNVIHTMGEAAVSCHGIQLLPEPWTEIGCDSGDEPYEASHEEHRARIERVEDEYFVTLDHAMTKEHYISFMAAVSSDRMQLVKLYPEGNPEARFQLRGVKYLYYYCNRDGLFRLNVRKAIPMDRKTR